MELIPILSTIILVATISTFILAIGAYILYKVREARGTVQTSAPKPAEVRGELLTPARTSRNKSLFMLKSPMHHSVSLYLLIRENRLHNRNLHLSRSNTMLKNLNKLKPFQGKLRAKCNIRFKVHEIYC